MWNEKRQCARHKWDCTGFYKHRFFGHFEICFQMIFEIVKHGKPIKCIGMKYLNAKRWKFCIAMFHSNTFDGFSMLHDFKNHLEAYFEMPEKPMLVESSAVPLVLF